MVVFLNKCSLALSVLPPLHRFCIPPSQPRYSEGTAQHDLIYKNLPTTSMEHFFMWAGSVNFPDVILPSYILDPATLSWLNPVLSFVFLWFSVIVLLNVATAVVYHEYEVDTKEKSAKQYVERRVAYVMVWSILQSLNVSAIKRHSTLTRQYSRRTDNSSTDILGADDDGARLEEKESEPEQESSKSGRFRRPTLSEITKKDSSRRLSRFTSSRSDLLDKMSDTEKENRERRTSKARKKFESSRLDSRKGTMNKATFDLL